MKKKFAKSYLSVAQKQLLRKQQTEIPDKVRTDFETAFAPGKIPGSAVASP